jgi:hypothetical protein
MERNSEFRRLLKEQLEQRDKQSDEDVEKFNKMNEFLKWVETGKGKSTKPTKMADPKELMVNKKQRKALGLDGV